MKNGWMRWGVGMALVLACVGLTACDDNDEKENPVETEATAESNAQDETPPSEEAEADASPADSESGSAPADEPAGPERFRSTYCGDYENENGSSHLSLLFRNQDGVLGGSFRTTGGEVGTISGSLEGFDLEFTLTVEGSGKWIRMDCTLNESGSAFSGTWTDSLGNSGTCDFQHCK